MSKPLRLCSRAPRMEMLERLIENGCSVKVRPGQAGALTLLLKLVFTTLTAIPLAPAIALASRRRREREVAYMSFKLFACAMAIAAVALPSLALADAPNDPTMRSKAARERDHQMIREL